MYVRGLALAARGDDAAAAEELRESNRSATLGIDGSDLYVSRTVLHELLAQAWDAAGARDRAAVHYAVVARLWGAGDPPYRARASAAAARLASLSRR